MGRKVAAFLAGLLVSTGALHGREPLRIQVSPTVSRAPATVTVRVNVETSPDNRFLQVIAESADFYASSQVQVNGASATPLSVVEFRNLPAGLYQVTGVLVGTQGPKGTASGLVKVVETTGSLR